MNKEILLVVDAVSNEKGVDKNVIFEALEAALASATRKKHGGEIDARVSINRQTGEYETFRRWVVQPDDMLLESPDREIRLMDAIDVKADMVVGDFIEEPMESVAFGRIAAQTAKQVIVQKVREAERAQVVEAYQGRIGELVTGLVKRVERGNVYIDLGNNAESFIPREDMIPREAVRTGDRIRGYLKDVRAEARGPQLFVTRTAPEFLIELFKLEVPEVGQGLIEIKGCSPRPGFPRQSGGEEQRLAHRSGGRLRRHAWFARAGRVQRALWRARGHRALGRQPGPVRHQRHVAC